MSKTKLYEIAAFPLTGVAVYRTLLVKYVLITIYALASIVDGVPEITKAAGHTYGLVWPAVLLLGSLAALAGVVRSRYTGHVKLEYAGTVALLAAMAGYGVAVVWLAITSGNWHHSPGAILAIVLTAFPFARLLNILGRNKTTVPVVTGEVPAHG
jgi:hypothetical protein